MDDFLDFDTADLVDALGKPIDPILKAQLDEDSTYDD